MDTMNNTINLEKVFGFGLVDLLISLFLTSIITTTLIQLYLSVKNQYSATQKELENSLDLLWATDLLADSVRSAGFTPCLGLDQLTLLDKRIHPGNSKSLEVQNHPRSLVVVHRMSENFVSLIATQNANQILVQPTDELYKQRPVIIADCFHAEIHDVDRVEKKRHALLITLAKPISFKFGSSTFIGTWLEERWFIKNNFEQKPALYYKIKHAEELTSLIHSMYIQEQVRQGRRMLEISLGLEGGKLQKELVSLREGI